MSILFGTTMRKSWPVSMFEFLQRKTTKHTQKYMARLSCSRWTRRSMSRRKEEAVAKNQRKYTKAETTLKWVVRFILVHSQMGPWNFGDFKPLEDWGFTHNATKHKWRPHLQTQRQWRPWWQMWLCSSVICGRLATPFDRLEWQFLIGGRQRGQTG
jgi:hypothetical protein